MQNTSSIVNAAETETEIQAGLALVQGDSVALAALPCRQSSAGIAARNQNGRTVRVFRFWHHLISFRAECEKPVDRPNPFSYLYLRRTANPELGDGALCDLRP